MVSQPKPSWVATDSQDNATATATKAAPSGAGRHFITHVSASFSTSQTAGKLLQLKNGATVIAQWYVHDRLVAEFDSPIELTAGAAASLVLAASGTGTQIGAVNIAGFTL